MKAPSSTQTPGDALLGDEPTPLPPPPFDLEDDHYGGDDEQPSWWSTIRPVSTLLAAGSQPHDLEVLAPSPAVVALPPLRPIRRRARTDEVSATAHVLRVRARLAPDEQRAFDELMNGPAATDIITMLVNRSEDDAVEKLRRRLDDEPTAAEASRRSLSMEIAAVSGLLSAGEKSRALAALSSLWPEELVALQARLTELPPPECAALIRTYLAPRCA